MPEMSHCAENLPSRLLPALDLTRALERIPIRWNSDRRSSFLFGRIFCDEPVSTSSENALGPRSHKTSAMPFTEARDLGFGITIRHHATIAEINERAWNRLFPDTAEDWGYFRGIELSGSTQFEFSAVAAYDGDRLIAAAPVFKLDYRLDMTLPPAMQKFGDWLARYAPRLVKVPLLGLGSPMTEECPIGFDRSLDAGGRKAVLNALIASLQAHAKANGIKILAFKDVTDSDAQWAGASLSAGGFAAMPSLPLATLDLPYEGFEDYLASLPGKQRTDIRKKMRQASGIEIELRDNVDDVYEEILTLYRATRENRKKSYDGFDEVPEDYFREVMSKSGGKARVLLARLGGKLVSFNFFLVEKNKVIGKFVGMDYEVARAHNLYFFNWMTIVKFCIDNGVATLQTGQTTYTVKVRLGCKLKRSWVYVKYNGAILGPLVRRLAPRISFAEADPDLAQLGDKAVYLSQAGAVQ